MSRRSTTLRSARTPSSAFAVSKIDEALRERNVEVNLDSFVDEATIRKVSGVVRELYAQEGYTDARVEPTTA